MNVYDFDKTIFYPDSTMTFLLYSLKRHPRWFVDSIGQTAEEFYNSFQSGDMSAFKEQAFSFVRYVPDINSYVEEFWENNLCKIERWYLKQKKYDDIIISASPDFMLRPLTDMLGVNLIATPMDPYSGQITGINNKGEEKVRRYKEIYGDLAIDEFYSDSDSDLPLARMANKAFKVINHKPVSWEL